MVKGIEQATTANRPIQSQALQGHAAAPQSNTPEQAVKATKTLVKNKVSFECERIAANEICTATIFRSPRHTEFNSAAARAD